METKREVSVRAKSSDAGGCNGCNDWGYSEVFEIRLQNVTVRVCYSCRVELLDKLRSAE